MVSLFWGYDFMCTFPRFLLSIRWYKQWKKYVGFDSWDTLNTGDETYNPGPIDNSDLLKGWFFLAWSPAS